MTHNRKGTLRPKAQAATPRRWGSGCPLKKRALPELTFSTPFLGGSKDKSGSVPPVFKLCIKLCINRSEK